MIKLNRKEDCCGCAACIQKCPKQAIDLFEDNEGFLYPKVDFLKCIDCGLCEKVCPVINQLSPKEPIAIYAAKHKDDQIRLRSSSGGVFSSIATKVIEEYKGVVFGCKFDSDWNAVHDFTETVEGIKAFRTSKYIQSRIGNSYKKVRGFLLQGRTVLFSGTPCQIAGLNRFLMKPYDNLLTVDVICHGVPSPGVWRKYLDELKEKGSARSAAVGKNMVLTSSLKSIPVITGINFREKQNGGFSWQKYGFVVRGMSAMKADKNLVLLSANYNDNPFMKGFLSNLYLRPSCYDCAAKEFKCGSDLSIADFWWIHNVNPQYADDKGVSKCYINTEKGLKCFESLDIDAIKTDSEYDKQEGYEYSGAEVKSAILTSKRYLFYSRWNKEGFSDIVEELTKPTFEERLVMVAKKILRSSSILTNIYKKYIKRYLNR